MNANHAYVYVMVRSDGIRKVGRTRNLLKRRKALRTTTGFAHEVERAWGMSHRATIVVESLAHRALKAWRHEEGLAKELFNTSLARIIRVVNAARRQARDSCPGGLFNYEWDGVCGGKMEDDAPLPGLQPSDLLIAFHAVAELGEGSLTYEGCSFVHRDVAGVGDGDPIPRHKIERLIRDLRRGI